MASPIRILLIDDHSLFRSALARLLANQPDFQVLGEAATIEEGIQALKNSPVDIVLLDIDLGLEQGGAFLGLARNEGFTGKTLVVTAGVSKIEASRLIQRGCCGIILKHERPERLIQSIRDAIEGRSAQPSAPEQVQQPGSPALPASPLTSREGQVLRAILAAKGNKEIASQLNISEPLVKSIVHQLFVKTGVRSRTQLVRVALEQYWDVLEESSSSSDKGD